MIKPHVHRYRKIGLMRLTRIDNPKYTGTPGDRAMLLRICDCGDKIAFEYGNTGQIEKLYATIRGDRHAVQSTMS